MPTELTFIYVLILVALAAVCSGLNVALMSLNPAELKRKVQLGDKRAKRVYPLRKNAHLSLASILLVNVAAASGAAIVLGDNYHGLVAGVIATLLLVIFSELAPQAFFTRRALIVCSYLAPLMRFMILVSYPLAKPLQLALDRILGTQDSNRLHTRHELGLMIGEHLGDDASELDEDEVEIIKGALQLSEKMVGSIMTEIRHVYWLTPDTVLDGRKIDEIKEMSWSRIPILDKKRTEVLGILLMKDLVDIDFDSRPYKVSELPLYPVKPVGSNTALDTMFRKFISAKTHLIPIKKNGDIVGIVTIEDLLEEIIGHEIIDESDIAAQRS
jgi:CBS domain containing-hemolysin-like protein